MSARRIEEDETQPSKLNCFCIIPEVAGFPFVFACDEFNSTKKVIATSSFMALCALGNTCFKLAPSSQVISCRVNFEEDATGKGNPTAVSVHEGPWTAMLFMTSSPSHGGRELVLNLTNDIEEGQRRWCTREDWEIELERGMQSCKCGVRCGLLRSLSDQSMGHVCYR